jgi:predicted DNA-binding transcriptional regulator AlpA
MSLTADDLAEGFYRTKDLMAMKVISSRSDLRDKQVEAGFPRPLKPGRKVALFPKAEVHRWLQKLAAERDEREDAKISVVETKPAPKRRAAAAARKTLK